MVDLEGRDKGNISLPAKLQSYIAEDEEQELPKNRSTIINMQRAFYSIRIEDIQNRIDRFTKQNDELLEEIETINEDSATIDADTAEEIANLTKQVFSQDGVVKSLKSKIETVETNRLKDKESLEHKIELFNQKYKKKKVELVSQIKVLNARINVLEDFKKVQAAFEEKLKANEVQMLKNEENVNEIFENIRRKIEFDKETLKNEMYECLLGLAADFQLETSKHISLPNQRLMRENIMLKNELLQISEAVSSKMDAQIHLKNSAIEHMKKVHSRNSIIKHNIIMGKVQDEILKRLRNRFGHMQQLFLSINIPDTGTEERYSMLIDNARREQDEVNFRLSSLKTLLHKDRTKVSVAKYILKTVECKIRAAVETIYDLKYTIICLLKCPSSRKDLQKLSCIELFLFLRDTLVKGQSKLGSFIIKSLESIPRELDPDADLKEIHEVFDLEVITELTEKESSTKDVIEKIDEDKDLEKLKEISTESSEELAEEAIASDEITSVASTLDSYQIYGEFRGEFDITDE